MTINTGMMGVTGGVSHADFVRNAQNVGMQKTNGIKSEHEETQQALSDSVSISFSSQTEESKGTQDTKENGKANSASQTGTTQETDKTQTTGQTQASEGSKESKETSSGTVTVDLSSSSAPTAGELDFNEGAIGSNLLSSETPDETSTALVPADGGSGNGGSGSTALVPVGGGPGTDIVPVGDSCTDVVPVVDAEVVDAEVVDAGNANASGETEETTETQQEDPLEALNKLKEMEEKWEEANKILMEIMTARQKHMAEMWKMIMDTQNSIYEMIEQSMQTQAATQDRIFMGWDMAINGGGR